MIKKLILCTQCNQVIPQFESFGDFGQSSLFPGVEWSDEDLDNQKEFFQCHRDHPLEELLVDLDTYISDKPEYESTKVSYFEAYNGTQRFLIRRCKEGVDQPAFYQLIPGHLQVSNLSFKIQEESLRLKFFVQNGPPLTEEKI